MIRVIALDLDGTLLTTNKYISAKTIETLQKCILKGYRIVIATGRRYQSAVEVLPPGFGEKVIICNNGTLIFENHQKVFENLISSQRALQIINWLENQYPKLTVTVVTEENFYGNRKSPTKSWIAADLKEMIKKPVSRIIAMLETAEMQKNIERFLPADCRLVVSDKIYGEIIPATASKAAALQVVLDKWNLTFENVVAFGNDLNDLEMLAESKFGVAMANSYSEVLRVADVITKSNDEDGIAVYLEKLLFEASA